MTKGWKIGLGVLAGVVVIGALAQPRPSTKPESVQAVDQSDNGAPAPQGVTMAGYERLRTGMRYREAAAILGEEGEEMSSNEIAGTRTVMYMWEGASPGANMNAMFQNDRLIQKAQFGLR